MSDARELGARAGLDQEDVDAFLLEEPGHLGVDVNHVSTAPGRGVRWVVGVKGGAERRQRPRDPDLAVAGLLAGPDGLRREGGGGKPKSRQRREGSLLSRT